MEPNKVVRSSAEKKKKRSPTKTTIQSLNYDILSKVFVSLDYLDLARCSTVCKSWCECINTSDTLIMKYQKRNQDSHLFANTSSCLGTSLKTFLKNFALEQHRRALRGGFGDIYQWSGHSSRVDQCRMKMGLILTGVGDKVARVWSVESKKCLEEYSVPGVVPLVDFDFDESKIVGLLGTRICIWRRHGERSIFPSRDNTVTSGLCMRYIDPEAVVGCEDGTARVFDMYSKKCSRIIRMHSGPVTCLALTDDQLIVSGSSLGSITLAGLSSDQRVASLRSTDSTGIRSLCFNPCSSLVFAGSTAGYLHCWDLRTRKQLWKNKLSSNVIYSVQHMRDDTSSIAVGGIDGVLRFVIQDSGELISSYIIGEKTIAATSSRNGHGGVEKHRAFCLEDAQLDSIPRYMRPAITCLTVGMKKVVTTHNSKIIRVWKFGE